MTPLHPTSLYAVELPEGKIDITLRKESVSWLSIIAWENIDGKRIAESSQIGLPEGDWIFHFTTATATEQDWDAVLPKESDPLTGDEYLDFITGKYIHHLSYKSGYSLLAANGLEVEKNYAILTLKNK